MRAPGSAPKLHAHGVEQVRLRSKSELRSDLLDDVHELERFVERGCEKRGDANSLGCGGREVGPTYDRHDSSRRAGVLTLTVAAKRIPELAVRITRVSQVLARIAEEQPAPPVCGQLPKAQPIATFPG
jgi:hypothetical protein